MTRESHPSTESDARISAKQAEYMELAGARKDADCREVKVTGGVSTKLGCCDKFKPESRSVQQFRCGTCKYVKTDTPDGFYGG